MIDSLFAIYNRTDFLNHPYAFQERLYILDSIKKINLNDLKPNERFQYATFNIGGGNTLRAIRILEIMSNAQQDSSAKIKIMKALGKAYLRAAEDVNCLNNHGATSCIIPLDSEAIHKDKTWAEKAKSIYTTLLDHDQEDYQSRWLLNIAYMALGEYPQNVPKEVFVPLTTFEDKEIQMSNWPNIAGNLGVDYMSLAGGTIIEDFDNDGYKDIITTSWGLKDGMKYYQNGGDGQYYDRTIDSGLFGLISGLNMVSTDFNNDGNVDFLILRGAWIREKKLGLMPNSLIRNNGDGTFTDITIESGLYKIEPNQTATWFDYDKDGYIDLFVGSESAKIEKYNSTLFRNNGDETFEDVTLKVGMSINALVKGSCAIDYDNDGWQDLFVSVLDGNNYLLKNSSDISGKRVFIDVTKEAGVDKSARTFPCWAFDYDNDGWEDLAVFAFDQYGFRDQTGQTARSFLGLEVQGQLTQIFHNNGDGTFTDKAKEMGLTMPLNAMGCNIADMDNDGYIDFYIGNGAPDIAQIVPNRMFLNIGGDKFSDVTFKSGTGHIQKGHGVSFGDLDNDGDSDMYLSLGGSVSADVFPNALHLNPGNSNHWVQLDLSGTTANKKGIGAKVCVVIIENGKERKIFKTANSGGSFGANTLTAEIGLGQAEKIKEIKITWPDISNTAQVFNNPKMDQQYRVEQGNPELLPRSIQKIQLASSGKNMNHEHHH